MIVHFIGHDAKGKILRSISCPDDQLAVQRPRPGEFFLEGEANSVTQKVVGHGKFRRIVDKTPAELEAIRMKNPIDDRYVYLSAMAW